MWTGLRHTHTHTHTHLQDNLQMMAISPHTCDGCVDPPSITHRTSRQSLAGFASTKRPIVTLYRSVHMVPAHDSQKHKLNVAYQHEQTGLYVYLAVHTITCISSYSKRPRSAAVLRNGGTSLALWTRVTSLHLSLSLCNWAYRWSVAGVVVWIYCSCHWQVRSYTDWPNTEHQHLRSVGFYYRVVVVVVIVVVYSLLMLFMSPCTGNSSQ